MRAGLKQGIEKPCRRLHVRDPQELGETEKPTSSIPFDVDALMVLMVLLVLVVVKN
jgi:hypothetical protein